MSEARDSLMDLVKHPGWAIYAQHWLGRWGLQGVQYHAELDKALNMTDSDAAHLQALQVRASRRMVEDMLGWPDEEAKRMGRAEEPEAALSPQRGGYHR